MYLTVGGKNFQQYKNAVQLQWWNVQRKDQADPDNKRPDNWSSTVCTNHVTTPAQQFMRTQPTAKRLLTAKQL